MFCSLLGITNWLQSFLLPCPFKKLTGIDCPGCGFQRSMLALLNGNLGESWHLYPATIPLLFTAVFLIIDGQLHIDQKDNLKKVFFLITGGIILIAYTFKMLHLYAFSS